MSVDWKLDRYIMRVLIYYNVIIQWIFNDSVHLEWILCKRNLGHIYVTMRP